jgi:hypothetical protein
MSKNELLVLLYGDASAKPDNFERLNPKLGNRVLPGEMIVIADPNSLECTARENDLMQIAKEVNQQVRQLSESEAQFIVDHYDLLEFVTANTATGLGVGATMIGQQIKSIKGTLKELEALYQDTFRKHGTLSHPEFFERRQQLFTRLDFALGKVARKGMSLDDSAKLKRALGLSSKSIVHRWQASGVGARVWTLLGKHVRRCAGHNCGSGLRVSRCGLSGAGCCCLCDHCRRSCFCCRWAFWRRPDWSVDTITLCVRVLCFQEHT